MCIGLLTSISVKVNVLKLIDGVLVKIPILRHVDLNFRFHKYSDYRVPTYLKRPTNCLLMVPKAVPFPISDSVCLIWHPNTLMLATTMVARKV